MLYRCPRTGAAATYYQLVTDRGVSWRAALDLLEEAQAAQGGDGSDDGSGFYQVGEGSSGRRVGPGLEGACVRACVRACVCPR